MLLTSRVTGEEKRERIMSIYMYEPFCKTKRCFVSATEATGGASVFR